MTPNQLNITVGSDVILNVTLVHEEETLIPALIDNLEANLISGLGKRTALETGLGADYITIATPWVEGRLAGCYSLEVKGRINGLAWAAIGKGLIRYTNATEAGADSVTVEADAYDVTMEAGYHYSDSPIAAVHVSVDDEYGTPSADVTYQRRVLGLDFHNLRGNGITEIDVDEQVGDEAVNTITFKTDADPEGTELQVRNGSRGNGIASSSEELSPDDGGTNTFTFTDDDGTEHVFHSKNGKQGDSFQPIEDVSGLVLAHTLGQDNTKAMSQKGVTDAFSDLGLRRISFTDGDFALADALGNILVLCSNGHIKVKNFDSSTMNLHIVGDSGADFDVADDDGNVIFRIAGGYVFTKNFSGVDVISRLNELEKETGKPDTFYYLKGMSKKDYAASKKIGIIVAGQSNARGATREAMPSALSAALPISNCHFVENLAYTQADYDAAPFDEFYPFSYSNPGRNYHDRWGFDAQLYYDIAVTDEQDMYVIKTAQGDTSIAPDGYGNGHWTADYETVSSGIKLIREFEKNIKQHVEDYGDNFDIRALVWHQGEGDRDKGADYYNNLKNFIDYVRGVVGNNQLPVIIGGISHLSSQWTQAVEDAQIRLTEEDPNIYLIDMSGAPLQTTYDTYHFNTASCVYLGHMVHDLLVDLGIVEGDKIEPTRPW